MQNGNHGKNTQRSWSDSAINGRFATPFSEEELGVPFGLPSRLTRLAEMSWHGCYEMQLASEKKSKHTLRSYRTATKQFLTTVLPGELPPSWDALQAIPVKDIARWVDPNNGRLDLWVQSISHLAAATINARLASVSHLLNWVGHRVPDWVTRPQKGRSLPKTLTHREVDRLKEAAATSENPFANVVITLLLDTGMRVSELCALDRSSVDIDDLSATVREGKGGKDRLVLFTESTVEAIEAYGMGNFNQACRESVWTYEAAWREMTERMAYWVDLDNPYVTLDNNYVESCWWALKQMFDKGFLYRGHKVLPYCPQTGTSYSSHEVALGYKEVAEPSVSVSYTHLTLPTKRIV